MVGRRTTKTAQAAVLKSMAEGKFDYFVLSATGQTYTAGTEYEVQSWTASGSDRLFSYLNIRVLIASSGSSLFYRLALVRHPNGAVPALDDAATLEGLKKDGKLVYWDSWYQPPVTSSRAIRWFDKTVFNYHLRDGETLGLYLVTTTTVTDGIWFGDASQREVAVG